MSHIQATIENGESSSCDKTPAEGLGKASRRLFIFQSISCLSFCMGFVIFHCMQLCPRSSFNNSNQPNLPMKTKPPCAWALKTAWTLCRSIIAISSQFASTFHIPCIDIFCIKPPCPLDLFSLTGYDVQAIAGDILNPTYASRRLLCTQLRSQYSVTRAVSASTPHPLDNSCCIAISAVIISWTGVRRHSAQQSSTNRRAFRISSPCDPSQPDDPGR